MARLLHGFNGVIDRTLHNVFDASVRTLWGATSSGPDTSASLLEKHRQAQQRGRGAQQRSSKQQRAAAQQRSSAAVAQQQRSSSVPA